MRHLKDTKRLGRTSSHQRCMMANMVKSLIEHEQITTTVQKAKQLRRHAEKIITVAKSTANPLAARRRAIAELMIRFNALTPKEARAAREGDKSGFNADRHVIEKLFDILGPRFASRQGGYTRIVKSSANRAGDNAQKCIIEYLPE